MPINAADDADEDEDDDEDDEAVSLPSDSMPASMIRNA
jgi:hypothetical protein